MLSYTRHSRSTFYLLLPFLTAGCDAQLSPGRGQAGDPNAPNGEVSPENGQDPTNPTDPTPPPGGDSGGIGISRDALEEACTALGEALRVGVTKLRRLSALEFNNTMQTLLGGLYVDYSTDLPDDEPMGPFVSNQSLPVGSQELRQYRTVAELVADTAVSLGTSFLPCPAPLGSDTACIEQFISEAVPRVFRRPLQGTEAQDLLSIYVVGRDGPEGTEADVPRGLRLLLRAIVGSPDLLYIVDTGRSGVPSENPEPVSTHTLANRLSLAFWNAPPDDELLELAASGALLDEAVYEAQVERVLVDPRAQEALAHFFAELTGLDELPKKEKNAELFPQFNEQLVQEMQEEQSEFVKDVVFAGDGTWTTLLSSNYGSPGPALASLYGASGPAPVVLPVDQRRGLFTQAGYLAAHNKPDETSPVHLGINVREAILCEVMPPPPPGVDTTLPEVSGEIRTSRDRFALHETGPCKNCHELIDPIGLAFEHYDAIGAYRETDNGAPIDPTGQIISTTGGEDGPMFTGALELSDQLAASPQVRDCVARQMLRSALDRQESFLDACSTLELVRGFDASAGNLRLLLSQIAQTPAFKNIVLNPPSETQQ